MVTGKDQLSYSKETHPCQGRGLGDAWCSVNVALHFSQLHNEISRMCTWYPKGQKIRDIKDKLTEIVPLLDGPGQVELTDDGPPTVWHDKHLPARIAYNKTKVSWRPNDSKTVCYQFDGKAHKTKNFVNAEQENEVLDFLFSRGFELRRLGWGMPLQECVRALSEAHFYIGVCSGMTHIAHSVRTPRFLVCNGYGVDGIILNHGTVKKYGMFLDASDIFQNFDTKYKELLNDHS